METKVEGQSPQHARNAALVLNVETGPVSPQLHAEFDLGFHAVKQRPEMESSWQIEARFVAQRRPTPEPTKTNLKEISRPAEGAPTGAPQPKQKRSKGAKASSAIQLMSSEQGRIEQK
jgi:hypothetical protein